ncbi:hypothetical protein C4587_02110 [Candidatus Parcubacteria bacterium]|nr:MAG: hypothetical protein C4587_02110 [Candidatus Parcubacteria bacterium]
MLESEPGWLAILTALTALLAYQSSQDVRARSEKIAPGSSFWVAMSIGTLFLLGPTFGWPTLTYAMIFCFLGWLSLATLEEFKNIATDAASASPFRFTFYGSSLLFFVSVVLFDGAG